MDNRETNPFSTCALELKKKSNSWPTHETHSNSDNAEGNNDKSDFLLCSQSASTISDHKIGIRSMWLSAS